MPKLYLKEYARALAGREVFIACREGILRITLEVRVSNGPALNLYRRQGYRERGLRKGYYQDNGEDAYIMWKHMKGETPCL